MPLTQAPWTVIVCRDEEAAVDLINGLLQQRDQQNVCTPPLSKLFCCKAQFVPLFLSSGEWQVILNRHRITLRNSKVKAVFSQICFSKFVSGTCCMGRQHGRYCLGAAAVRRRQSFAKISHFESHKSPHHCPGPPSAPPVL